MKNKGLFITFEGNDGSGKTTQINALKEWLNNKGYRVVITREPGGTRISEVLRDIILTPEYKEMDDVTEMLLYAASRAQHVKELILPALQEGKIVISDRFVDSSIVYQGMGRNIGYDTVKKVNDYAIDGCMPTLTFFIDISAEDAMKRVLKNRETDRLEQEKMDFHRAVYKGYKKLAKDNPNRIKSIDGLLAPNEISKEIISIINKHIEGDFVEN